MKNIYSTLKFWIIAIAFGETITSYYKDKDFKTKLDNSEGFDKIKILFDNLFDINKKFIRELSSFDYNLKYNKIKDNIEKSLNEFNEKLDQIKENINNYKEEKISPVLEDIYAKANELKGKIQYETENLNEKYKLAEKLDTIKDKIANLSKKMKK